MANAKKGVANTTTGATVYVIINRESDDYLLNDADGAFASAPADPYVSMTEHATLKGRYAKSESRTVWTDGQYGWTAYKQAGGSPSPVADTVIGAEIMTVVNDLEVTLDAPVSFLMDCIKNKKYLVKSGSTWYLKIRNTADTADIVSKALKGTDGTTEITDVTAAALGMEIKSTV